MKKNDLEFLKERVKKIPILNVAEYLNIKVDKTNKVLCLFHEEKTPSLSFSEKLNIYKCFSCGEHGDNINLIMKIRGVDFVEACKLLANTFFGENFDISNKSGILSSVMKKANISKKRKIRTFADTEIYNWIIENSKMSAKGYDYLCRKRFFPKEVIDEFQIKDIENTKEFFSSLEKKFGRDRLISAGIITKKGYIWNKYTILFPFLSIFNDVLFIQGREIPKKFINISVPTTIWNWKSLDKKEKEILICEGITDGLAAVSMGMNSIAVTGANSFKDHYVDYFEEMIVSIASDNDEAGDKMYNRIVSLFKKKGIKVKKMELKGFKDLDEMRRCLKVS